MHCTSCGSYYRITPFNNTSLCDDCLAEDSTLQGDFEVERDLLLNPSGKTKPVFYDEEDSHGL